MKKLTKNNKGFTLIELLVVVAIIGLLSSVVLISLNTARSKARDAKRLADVRQVATALETYYNDNGKYPEAASNPTTAAAAHTYLGGTLTPATPAFSTYMTVIPQAPTPADGACTSSNNPYMYTGAAGGTTFTLAFCLGGTTGGYSSGTRSVTPNGIQ